MVFYRTRKQWEAANAAKAVPPPAAPVKKAPAKRKPRKKAEPKQ